MSKEYFGCYVFVNLNCFRLSKGWVPCLPSLIAFVIILIFPCQVNIGSQKLFLNWLCHLEFP